MRFGLGILLGVILIVALVILAIRGSLYWLSGGRRTNW